MYIVGGEYVNGHAATEAEVFDLNTNRWTQLSIAGSGRPLAFAPVAAAVSHARTHTHTHAHTHSHKQPTPLFTHKHKTPAYGPHTRAHTHTHTRKHTFKRVFAQLLFAADVYLWQAHQETCYLMFG